MANEKIYRFNKEKLVNIPARDPAKYYRMTDVAGEPAYIELTDGEEAFRAKEEADHLAAKKFMQDAAPRILTSQEINDLQAAIREGREYILPPAKKTLEERFSELEALVAKLIKK